MLSVSATTRPRREGETEGRDYFFLSEEEFRRWVEEGRFLEWAPYCGYLYGTPRQAVEEYLRAGQDVLLEIELEGARQVLEQWPDALMVFIMPPSVDELERRLRCRNTETEAARRTRLAQAAAEIATVKGEGGRAGLRCDYVIVNDSVERASEELAQIILKTREDDEQTNR